MVVVLGCDRGVSPAEPADLLRTDVRRDVSQCSELQDALDEALGYNFAPGIRWIIQVRSDTGLQCQSPVILSHLQGEAVEIRGPAAPELPVDVWFPNVGDGILVDGGKVGWLDGLDLQATRERSDADVGIRVRRGGTLRVGSNVRILGFPTGLTAEEGSRVHIESSRAADPQTLRIEDARVVGVYATSGAIVDAPDLLVRAGSKRNQIDCEAAPSCSLPEALTGHGILAELGAMVWAPGARIRCHMRHGVLVRTGAGFTGPHLITERNGCDGLYVAGDAMASARGGRFELNGRDGVRAVDNASVELPDGRVQHNAGVGLYADTATIAAGGASRVVGHSPLAVAADRGAAISLGSEALSVETGDSARPAGVCVGVASVVYVEPAPNPDGTAAPAPAHEGRGWLPLNDRAECQRRAQ